MQQIHSQQELDAALAAGASEFELVGDIRIEISRDGYMRLVVKEARPSVVARGSSQPSVEAWGSSRPSVEAWESSRPSVVARESSQPSVEAWESSQPSVVAWGSSRPSVVARESSQPSVEARESSRPSVVAWGSSQPSVEAWGSSRPSVVAWGSSRPSVVAWGSSRPSVVARESSQPSVEAWGSNLIELKADGYVQISVCGRVKLAAGKHVQVRADGKEPKVTGGAHVIRMKPRTTAKEWCDYYGVPIVKGVVTLFKAVRGDYSSSHDPQFFWTPGTKPSVPKMDAQECGVGLHACAHPQIGRQFYSGEDVRFIACPVKLSDIKVAKNPSYPNKVKFQKVCAPVYEVDEFGERIEPTPTTEKVA